MGRVVTNPRPQIAQWDPITYILGQDSLGFGPTKDDTHNWLPNDPKKKKYFMDRSRY